MIGIEECLLQCNILQRTRRIRHLLVLFGTSAGWTRRPVMVQRSGYHRARKFDRIFGCSGVGIFFDQSSGSAIDRQHPRGTSWCCEAGSWGTMIKAGDNLHEHAPLPGSSFDLADEGAYRRWRDDKLLYYPANASDLMVEIGDLANPGDSERHAIADRCRKANMAFYQCRREYDETDRLRNDLLEFARSMGLVRMEGHWSAAEDGIVALHASEDESRKGYIPYTDKPLSWHTDGYYNAPANRISAFVLHCVRAAPQGGDNGFFDPEIAYIRLRDENPDYVSAFMHPEAMTIPANATDGDRLRGASIGPVFSIDQRTGALHMRYTARTRSIEWRNDPVTQAAVKFLADTLANGDQLMFRLKLAPGQGVLCNNVLHRRTQFQNALSNSHHNGRLLYRMRYLDRIAGSGAMAEMTHWPQRGN